MSAEPAPGKLDSLLQAILWWVVTGSLLATSLVFTIGGADWWRWPKEIVLRGAAIVLVALLVTIALVGASIRWRPLSREYRKLVLLLAAMVVWCTITFAFSTNRPIGVPALAYTASLMAVFVATFVAVAHRSVSEVMAVPLIAGLINALVTLGQGLGIWNPFRFDSKLARIHHTSGLQGNPNDVGDYLLVVVLAAVAFAFVKRHVAAWIIVAILAVAVVATQSLAAFVALCVGVLTITVLNVRRRSAILFVIILFAAIVAMSYAGPVRERLHRLRDAVEARDIPNLTSGRIFGAATAWNMFLDRPLIGMGPGTYKFHYLAYRREFNERHPRWIGVFPENFGEAHSDHLQFLAEEGLPGYALFLAALVFVARASLRGRDGERAQFIRALGLPLIASLATLTLAAFPLELAGTTHMLVYFAAAITRWSEP